MEFRHSQKEDFPALLDMLKEAKEKLKSRGIPQWQGDYPNLASFEKDYQDQVGFVLVKDQKIIGYTTFILGEEPSYQEITGKWLTSGPYATLHRVMIKRNEPFGISNSLMEACLNLAKEKNLVSLRVDTHEKNQGMLLFLKRFGFQDCGEITLIESKEKRRGLEKKIGV